jgi:hypothetical protein
MPLTLATIWPEKSFEGPVDMADTQRKDQAQRNEMPSLEEQVDQNGPPLPPVSAEQEAGSGFGARLSLLVWLAVFLFLAALLIWDLIAAMFRA